MAGKKTVLLLEVQPLQGAVVFLDDTGHREQVVVQLPAGGGHVYHKEGQKEQKKAARSGYDMDILPPDLVTYSNDAKTLLEDLQSRNERMFLLTFLVVNMAPTRRELDNDLFTVSGIVQKYNCT